MQRILTIFGEATFSLFLQQAVIISPLESLTTMPNLAFLDLGQKATSQFVLINLSLGFFL